MYFCGDGVYVTNSAVCDGVVDCNGGEDEQMCEKNCTMKNKSAAYKCFLCLPHECTCKSQYFHCANGGCVSLSHTCDFVNDCGDWSDEHFCQYFQCTNSHFDCGDGTCIDINKMCDRVTDCLSGKDETRSVCNINQCDGLKCKSGECIQKLKINNFIPDCMTGDDEIEYIHLASETYFAYKSLCPNGTLPCYIGHSTCFNIENMCYYDTESDGTLSFCGNGGHLQFCLKMKCPQSDLFKCPDAYCIPYRKLCDGVIDCPGGEDEKLYCPLSECPPNMYRCQAAMMGLFIAHYMKMMKQCVNCLIVRMAAYAQHPHYFAKEQKSSPEYIVIESLSLHSGNLTLQN